MPNKLKETNQVIQSLEWPAPITLQNPMVCILHNNIPLDVLIIPQLMIF